MARKTGTAGRIAKAAVERAPLSAKGRSAKAVRNRRPIWHKTARKYQNLTVAHGLRAPKCGILLDPGMGKTSCCLEICWQLRQRKMFDKAWVVSTLRGAKEVWGDGPNNERDKWQYPFTVNMLHGPKKDERLADDDADMNVINWDGLDWLAKKWPHRKKLKGHVLIIDESTKGKNHGARRSKALLFLSQFFDRVIILTGTPTPRSMEDLWGQVFYLDGGAALGRYITQFRAKYFDPGKRIRNPHKEAMIARGVPRHRVPDFITTEWVLKEGAEEAIYDAISHLIIRFSDKLLGLKEPVVSNLYFDLPDDAMDEYLRAEEEAVTLDEGGKVVTKNAGARTIRQRQIANGGVYVDGADEDAPNVKRVRGHKRKAKVIHQIKAEMIADLSEELGGKPLLVGFEFTHDRDRLLAVLGKDVPYIDGSVSLKDGSRIMAEFNRGEHPILLAQMSAVAHAVNLQAACHHIAFYAMTYDLEIYIQFMKRVLRGGQRNVVHIYHLLARDTVDEDMLEIITIKDADQRSLLARFERNAKARLRRMVTVRGKRKLQAAA